MLMTAVVTSIKNASAAFRLTSIKQSAKLRQTSAKLSMLFYARMTSPLSETVLLLQVLVFAAVIALSAFAVNLVLSLGARH
jgi:hypothetical protein